VSDCAGSVFKVSFRPFHLQFEAGPKDEDLPDQDPQQGQVHETNDLIRSINTPSVSSFALFLRNNEDSWDFTQNLHSSDANNNEDFVGTANGQQQESFLAPYALVQPLKRRAAEPLPGWPLPKAFLAATPAIAAAPFGPVCMVYELNARESTPQRLFNLLCLYGDVARVKFLASKSGCAMVEMADVASVRRVIDNLSGCTLFGCQIAVRPSRQGRVVGNAAVGSAIKLDNGAASFADFTGSADNR